ncbi:MAG: prepilin-type N-terminal cleavage/methylation domain-containing protein [Eubacterium sp.]|nr:prepilin-type N-terminal cleavage/methylation domain-containing protein [Eubacterium sp.]
MKRNNKGFSLVELLIAMAVSSIVLTALVLLVAQSVKSYSKQTSLAQIQSDADVVLNQISKSILEADIIYIDKTDAYVKFYTKKVDDTSDSTKPKIKWGYYYDKAEKKLYYTDDTLSKKSEACDYVEDFDVKLSKSNFTLKDGHIIEALPTNPEIQVSITLERMKNVRTVTREYMARNKIGDNITLQKATGGEVTLKATGSVAGDKSDLSKISDTYFY